MIEVEVNVWPNDIAEGEAGNCRKCPMARAMYRINWVEILDCPSGRFDEVAVSHGAPTIKLFMPNGRTRCWAPHWPEHVTRWIKCFDRWPERLQVGTINFKLKIDPEAFYDI